MGALRSHGVVIPGDGVERGNKGSGEGGSGGDGAAADSGCVLVAWAAGVAACAGEGDGDGAANNAVAEAVGRVRAYQDGLSKGDGSCSAEGGDWPGEAWADDTAALVAIFGDEAVVSSNGLSVRVTLDVIGDAAASTGGGVLAPTLTLALPEGACYPDHPPAVLLSGVGVGAARVVLRRVLARARAGKGAPMGFDLVTEAKEARAVAREGGDGAGVGEREGAGEGLEWGDGAVSVAGSVAGTSTVGASVMDGDTVVLDSMEDMAADLSEEDEGDGVDERGRAGRGRGRGAGRREVSGVGSEGSEGGEGGGWVMRVLYHAITLLLTVAH